jgi:hypothetical protein
VTKIIKHEWHRVDSQYSFVLTLETLQEIYPDKKKKELKKILSDIENGKHHDIGSIIDDALENNIEIEWDHEYDDWVTDRKGDYDITFNVEEDE